MIGGRDARRITSHLRYVIEHNSLLLRDRRCAVVLFESSYKLMVQRYPTQKLCVRFDSIETTVRDRYHRRDHLVLSSVERQVRRHQRPKRRKRMIQRRGNQTVGRNDPRCLAVGGWMNGRCVFDRIQRAL